MAIIETVPFSFDELYTSLQTQFSDAGYDTAEGSNVSQLVTAMAYFTSMLNVNTAVNINETLLPLATVRDNVLADARALGYEIQHKQSYSYRVSLNLTGAPWTAGFMPDGITPRIGGDYIIPKFTQFTDGSNTYYYMGEQQELLNMLDGSIVELNPVVEGTLYQYGDHPDTLQVTTIEVENEAGETVPQFYIDIPFVDVEENGIECFVTYYDDFGNLVTNEPWQKSAQFMIDKDLVVNNKFFRMDDIGNKTPRVYFEIAGVGTGLRLGTDVNFNVLTTSGIDGALQDINNTSGFSHTIPDVTITEINLITEGADEETISSIKDNAPKFYNSANRAVTANDYQAICNRQSSIQDSMIWGGDEELPKSPGHIWFSFLPSTLERAYTTDEFNLEYVLNNFMKIDWDYTFDDGFGDTSGASEVVFDNTAKTITTTTVDFLVIGISAGEYITITGSSNNDGTFLVESVTQYELTLDAGETLADYNPDSAEITFAWFAPFETQLAASDAYYSLRYLEDSEIVSTQLNDAGQLIQPGVWDVLDNFKIPTLEFHNRHPIYLDFEYDVEILKYDVVTSKADINEGVFQTIDGYFTDTVATPLTINQTTGLPLEVSLTPISDIGNLEQFEEVYFHSSLEKRIDAYLTDSSGYNNTVATKLLLTQKNVAKENISNDYRDIYISLDIPYEDYFDADGYLVYSALPSIDTSSFIDYRTLDDVASGFNIPTTNIYTDWSDIQADIDGLTAQQANQVIIAPVRASMSEIHVAAGTEATVTLTEFGIYPDDPAILDSDPGNETYLKTTVTHIAVGGAETVLTKDLAGTIGWSFDEGVTFKEITLETSLTVGESLRVECEAMCGNYILFNSFKKYITVQLFIDALDYTQGSTDAIIYDTPKSYLTTTDNNYEWTTEAMYLTTDGYSLTSQSQIDVLTGPIIKSISPNTYIGSPLRMDLFRRDRYLNLNYVSPNFKLKKNIIPRLKRVTFE